MYSYSGTVVLKGNVTLDEARSIVETMRASGTVVLEGLDRFVFRVDADDLWDLRNALAYLESELVSYNITLNINRDNVHEKEH